MSAKEHVGTFGRDENVPCIYPASNLNWRFVSYMILYMFQCHSPKSSHPLRIFNFQNFLTYKSSDINLAFLALKIFQNESLF